MQIPFFPLVRKVLMYFATQLHASNVSVYRVNKFTKIAYIVHCKYGIATRYDNLTCAEI